jgi:pimeloyl-ACP methyl ester carboxylesterase
MIQANGVELCTETFGDPADPPVLLLMGGGSMLWWDEGFCARLAARGRFVVRYDQRDTGRSTTYAHGRPGYGSSDLLADACAILDAYGFPAAQIVGMSAGGGLAQELALGHPERLRSLVLISTSPVVSTGRTLPSPTAAFTRFAASVEVDWSDPALIVDYLVEYWRALAGDQRPFDEAAVRDLARRDVERARDPAAAQNLDLLTGEGPSDASLRSIAAPTLVIHGTADPMFPVEHGAALADAIPGARLLRLEGAGHGFDRSDWDTVVEAIVGLG